MSVLKNRWGGEIRLGDRVIYHDLGAQFIAFIARINEDCTLNLMVLRDTGVDPITDARGTTPFVFDCPKRDARRVADCWSFIE